MPSLASPATVADAFRFAIDTWAPAGIASPRTEAEWLLTDLLSTSRADLYLYRQRRLTPTQHRHFQDAVRRRAKRIPLQQILGKAEFFSLPFKVTPQVLIPRPETEVLVESLIERLQDRPSPSILDLGTGSGAIAVALAHTLPACEVVASDLSAEALRVARENARLNRVDRSLAFVRGDLLSPFCPRPIFHAIVSNPPYICSGDLPGLQPEVREFEPRAALDGGPDGLRYSRTIVSQAASHLHPGGWLALEVGDDQAVRVANLFHSSFEKPETVRDLTGVERVLLARKVVCG